MESFSAAHRDKISHDSVTLLYLILWQVQLALEFEDVYPLVTEDDRTKKVDQDRVALHKPLYGTDLISAELTFTTSLDRRRLFTTDIYSIVLFGCRSLLSKLDALGPRLTHLLIVKLPHKVVLIDFISLWYHLYRRAPWLLFCRIVV